jgi:predicted DCC family thiol-disulfide oxidoreductase YuxK
MSKGTLKVYFDGQCPLCRREIDFYRKRSGGEKITWINIEDGTCDGSTLGLTKKRLKARFHVVKDDSTVFSGGYAFLQLWSFIPVFSWLAKILDRSFFPSLLDKLYDLFLIVRPTLQKILIKIENNNKK